MTAVSINLQHCEKGLQTGKNVKVTKRGTSSHTLRYGLPDLPPEAHWQKVQRNCYLCCSINAVHSSSLVNGNFKRYQIEILPLLGNRSIHLCLMQVLTFKQVKTGFALKDAKANSKNQPKQCYLPVTFQKLLNYKMYNQFLPFFTRTNPQIVIFWYENGILNFWMEEISALSSYYIKYPFCSHSFSQAV